MSWPIYQLQKASRSKVCFQTLLIFEVSNKKILELHLNVLQKKNIILQRNTSTNVELLIDNDEN